MEETETKKKCKHCRQSIPVDANKCYRCNEWQDITDNREPSPPQNLWSLATSSGTQIGKALGFLAGVVTILIIGFYFGIKIFTSALPAGASIEMRKEGAIVLFTAPNETKAAFLLSPNGTTTSPWVSTGIKVNKNDKVTIQASGAVSLNIHHTVDAARRDERPVSPWCSPNGLADNWEGKRPLDKLRTTNVLMDGENFGKLIAQVASVSPNEVPPITSSNMEAIGLGKTFTAKQDGVLYLTVNEVWLTTDEKENKDDYDRSHNAYAHGKIEGNELYYLERSRLTEKEIDDLMTDIVNLLKSYEDKDSNREGQKAIDALRRKDKTPKIEELLKKVEDNAEKGKSVQEDRWKYIAGHHYNNIWYDDNIGAFSVTIEINK